MFMSNVFRVYISPDVLGICIGGALKNVIALAAGIADGLGYGDNTKAALITRGIAEITRLGLAMGADFATFSGLSGIGRPYCYLCEICTAVTDVPEFLSAKAIQLKKLWMKYRWL